MTVRARRPRDRIAVVGGGATGVLVAIRVMRRLIEEGRADGARLTLFEARGPVGAGVAYGTPHDCHLLNMRIETMTLFEERPGDFADWLHRRSPGANGTGERAAYLPRRLFAEYVRSGLETVAREARDAGLELRIVADEVTDCTANEDGVVLTVGARTAPFDFAVLCPGDLPATSFQEHRGEERYVASPWDFAALARIPPDARVAILGAGLSAVDVVLLLRERGHDGRIAFFTRASGLPKVQPRPDHDLTHVPRVLTHATIERLTKGYTRKLTLREVAGLFQAEIEQGAGRPIDLSYDPASLGAEHGAAQMRRDIERSRAGTNAWYGPLTSTWPIIGHVWHHMRAADRAEVMERHYSFWGMHRHCIPLATAERLSALFELGQLEGHSGLDDIAPEGPGRGFALACRAPGGGVAEHRYDFVVNATGTGLVAERLDSKLLRNMLERGELAAHPDGGIDVDFDTLRVRSDDGRCARRVFLIGPLTRGVHFYTNGVEISRKLAEPLVESLLETAVAEVASSR